MSSPSPYLSNSDSIESFTFPFRLKDTIILTAFIFIPVLLTIFLVVLAKGDTGAYSGLYETLVTAQLLIPHEEVDIEGEKPDKAHKTIKPELIPFISYPYEWCFSQLKNAALTTLVLEKKALDFGMSQKDCSAYNMQFRKGKPILIDTLSFEKYSPGLRIDSFVNIFLYL